MAERSKKKRKTKVDDELMKILESRKAVIKVVGCGGAGNNTITRINEVGIVGVETIAINTDAQDLLYADADRKILIGKEITAGLGAGADPKIGEEAAKESREEIRKALQGSDMVFITAGLGGGTGTGSAPIVAEVAKKLGALTIAVVTFPFSMEGKHRFNNAVMGYNKLKQNVDTIIVIPNDKLLEVVPDVSITTAFKIADEILTNAVKGIVELVTKPGLVNLDFADVRAVMSNNGTAMVGIGESDTERRAPEAAEKALNNPLLDVEIDEATGALINIAGGQSMTIKECQEIVEIVGSRLAPNAKIIWGAMIEPELGDTIRAMIIVTGIKMREEFLVEDTSKKKERKKEMEKILGIDVID